MKRKKEKKGGFFLTNKTPFRLEILLPSFIVFLVFFIYSHFFFDFHLRKALEWIGTSLYRGEINIGRIQTQFLKASFTLDNLEVTNKKEPSKNLIQVGRLRFSFLWDALLRFKFVMNEARMEGVRFSTQRKYPGRLLPPKSSSLRAGKFALKFKDAFLKQLSRDQSKNILGDISSLLLQSHPKDRLRDIESSLNSNKTLNTLEESLKVKKIEWEKKIKTLLKKEELKKWIKTNRVQLENELKGRSKNGIKNSIKILKNLRKVLKEGDQKIKRIKEIDKDLKSDFLTYEDSIKNLEKTIREDLVILNQRLSVPDFDVGGFSKKLFQNTFKGNFSKLFRYVELIKKYRPIAKRDHKKKTLLKKEMQEESEISRSEASRSERREIRARPRSEGKNYVFPKKLSYPPFWLKEGFISSEFNAVGKSKIKSEVNSKVSGIISDLTFHPSFIMKPTRGFLKGDFPELQVYDFSLNLILDEVAREPYQSLKFHIGSYPVSRKVLSQHKSLFWEFKSGKATLDVKVLLKERSFRVDVVQSFFDIEHDIKSESKTFKNILDQIVLDFPKIVIQATFYGSSYESEKDFHSKISSNIGGILSERFKLELGKKVQKIKERVNDDFNKNVVLRKENFLKDLREKKRMTSSELQDRKDLINQAKAGFKKIIEKGRKKERKNKIKKLEGKGKKLLKKFGF